MNEIWTGRDNKLVSEQSCDTGGYNYNFAAANILMSVTKNIEKISKIAKLSHLILYRADRSKKKMNHSTLSNFLEIKKIKNIGWGKSNHNIDYFEISIISVTIFQ